MNIFILGGEFDGLKSFFKIFSNPPVTGRYISYYNVEHKYAYKSMP